MTIKLQDIYGLAAIDIGGPIQLHDPAKTYTAGDIVVQGDTIYQAKGAVPAGAFDATQWNHAVWDKDIREKISADLDLYVRPGGNDANAGTIDDDAHALASINGAFDRLTDYDLGAYDAIINVAAGDYPAEIKFEHSMLGGKRIMIKGAGAATTKIGGLNVNSPVSMDVTDVTFSYKLSVYNRWVNAAFGARLSVTNCTFDLTAETTASYVAGSNNRASLMMQDCTIHFGNITLVSAFLSADTGFLGIRGTITQTGTAAINPGYGYLSVTNGSVINATGLTAINGGTVTGPKFKVNILSYIQSNNKAQNWWPGSTAGTIDTATYGVYI